MQKLKEIAAAIIIACFFTCGLGAIVARQALLFKSCLIDENQGACYMVRGY